MTADLFSEADLRQPARSEVIGPGSWLHRGLALPHVEPMLDALRNVLRRAPLRFMHTAGGKKLNVALSNCGSLGWISDKHGYRYAPLDPLTGQPWPALPDCLIELAGQAASLSGYADFVPDACLINRYVPGTRLTLHQDRNERDFSQPIVSISLGLPAVFLFGGLSRADRCARISLLHGDVAVWGGEDRLRFHGILPLPEGDHPQLGAQRINVTLRMAR